MAPKVEGSSPFNHLETRGRRSRRFRVFLFLVPPRYFSLRLRLGGLSFEARRFSGGKTVERRKKNAPKILRRVKIVKSVKFAETVKSGPVKRSTTPFPESSRPTFSTRFRRTQGNARGLDPRPPSPRKTRRARRRIAGKAARRTGLRPSAERRI